MHVRRGDKASVDKAYTGVFGGKMTPEYFLRLARDERFEQGASPPAAAALAYLGNEAGPEVHACCLMFLCPLTLTCRCQEEAMKVAREELVLTAVPTLPCSCMRIACDMRCCAADAVCS